MSASFTKFIDSCVLLLVWPFRYSGSAYIEFSISTFSGRVCLLALGSTCFSFMYFLITSHSTSVRFSYRSVSTHFHLPRSDYNIFFSLSLHSIPSQSRLSYFLTYVCHTRPCCYVFIPDLLNHRHLCCILFITMMCRLIIKRLTALEIFGLMK